MWRVRAEDPVRDGDRVRAVVTAAFGQPDEAVLVEQLWAEGAVLLSLVAEESAGGGGVIGHILFSRMWIGSEVPAVALAPLAVHPDRQQQGAGGALIREGLRQLREAGESIVIVLGHPGYYPRFGFSVTAAEALESPFRRESFMALELVPGALQGVRGRVRYAAAFGLE